jgi:hypothetical protein
VLENRLAVGAFVAGGLGAIAGALLVALNQPRPVEVVPAGSSVSLRVRF